jgi:hypothetical protein
MAKSAAVGDGPVVFFTDQGQQVFLPLSDIHFDGDVVGSDTEPSSATDPLGKWLRYLVAQGRLVPGPTPAPGPAMVFTAVGAGSAGNNIVVTVTANGATKVDITVTETDTYEGLTVDTALPSSLDKVLGTTAAGSVGTQPGLVRVQPIVGRPPDPAPVVMTSQAPPWDVVDAGGNTSFTLEPRGPGSDVAQQAGTPPYEPKWTIEVAKVVQPPGGAAKTFTLKVAWTNTVTVGAADLTVDPTDPASKLVPLAFAVTITKPNGSAGLTLPRLGSATLRGGAEPAPATKARATLLANA